jgi:NifU-like protein involved in Fe-S cluster formation
MYLILQGQSVSQAKFEAQGCGVTIAACSALTELIHGMPLSRCIRLSTSDLIQALGGVPDDRNHSPEVAMGALRDALQQLGAGDQDD